MPHPQAAILAPLPAHARYLSLQAVPGADWPALWQQLHRLADGKQLVFGLGVAAVVALGLTVPALHEFSAPAGSLVALPATPADVWLWFRGSDRGDLLLHSQEVVLALAPYLQVVRCVDAYTHAVGRNGIGRDLSGYEDGTENPVGKAAATAAIAPDGSSCVAIQHWRHDFAALRAMTEAQRNHCIGRRRTDNKELTRAPKSAHVKRTAQENFVPEAFLLRRSMPWSEGQQGGLHFVAFGRDFAAFEAQLRRMSGAEDGVVDGLFAFSQPQTGEYFWCPPLG